MVMIDSIDPAGTCATVEAPEHTTSGSDAAAFSQVLMQQDTASSPSSCAAAQKAGTASSKPAPTAEQSAAEKIAAMLKRLGKLGVKTYRVSQFGATMQSVLAELKEASHTPAKAVQDDAAIRNCAEAANLAEAAQTRVASAT